MMIESTRTPAVRLASRSEPTARTSRPSQVKAKIAPAIRKIAIAIRLRAEKIDITGSFSQMLTLFTTPVIYLAFDRLGRRLRGMPLDTPAYPRPAAAEGGPAPGELPEGYQP